VRPAFIGGGVPGFPATRPGLCCAPAFAKFEDVEDRYATLPARNGISAVEGLAIHNCEFALLDSGSVAVAGHLPRRAIEAADLVVDNMLATRDKGKQARREWRGARIGLRTGGDGVEV
jgi:hypothetical protein